MKVLLYFVNAFGWLLVGVAITFLWGALLATKRRTPPDDDTAARDARAFNNRDH